MSPETLGPGERIHNEVIFPADGLARILELPERLSPWFKTADTEKIINIHTNNLGVMISQLTTAYNRTNHVKRPRAHHTWFDEQAIARQDILNDVASRGGTYTDGVGSVRIAMRAQCAGEYAYLSYATRSGDDIDDETLESAGSMTKTMKPLFGVMRRIMRGGSLPLEDTPEGLAELEENVDAYRTLLLFENHVHASMVLETCLALGSKKDVKVTLNMYKKMQDIARNEYMNSEEKLEAQAKVIATIGQIADSVGFGQIKPPVSDYMRRQVDNMNKLAASNAHELDIFSLVIRGRHHRLGKQQKETAEGQEHPSALLAGEVSLQTSAPAEESAPAPNYSEQLDEMLGKLDLRQPVVLGGKEIRRRQLDAARAMFIRGAADGDGKEIVAGRSAYDTQRLLSDIEFVLSFIPSNGNLSIAQKELKAAAEDSAKASHEMHSLLAKAREDLCTADLMELTKRAPTIREIGSVLEQLRADWPAISYVIDQAWPAGRKPTTHMQLEELLFPSDANAQLTEATAA
ncbi:MAG TPA: hypothetical protein VHB72_04000 [Candidatus Saccharimonadales bacterium]|nr:hypothetical protein [Candidatus Saccharimonadales bacterium]